MCIRYNQLNDKTLCVNYTKIVKLNYINKHCNLLK